MSTADDSLPTEFDLIVIGTGENKCDKINKENEIFALFIMIMMMMMM